MTPQSWKWKNKDGAQGGLLYDSGNWGDILKMLWIAEIVRWKQQNGCTVNYRDPFAGDVQYPLGKKITFRLNMCALPELDFLNSQFRDNGFWPSAALGAMLLASGRAEVWDADEGRRDAWRTAGVPVVENAASGWEIVARAAPDPDAVLLVDPYDFLAEWQEQLPLVAEKSRGVSTLLYLYNRSGKSKEAFADYRRFRGKLDDLMGDAPKRIGRVAADGFLPDSYHEMIFLPSAADAAGNGFGALLDRLGDCAFRLLQAQARASVFDC